MAGAETQLSDGPLSLSAKGIWSGGAGLAAAGSDPHDDWGRESETDTGKEASNTSKSRWGRIASSPTGGLAGVTQQKRRNPQLPLSRKQSYPPGREQVLCPKLGQRRDARGPRPQAVLLMPTGEDQEGLASYATPGAAAQHTHRNSAAVPGRRSSHLGPGAAREIMMTRPRRGKGVNHGHLQCPTAEAGEGKAGGSLQSA